MFLDHPVITATNSNIEFDRIERLGRVYGYVVGLADLDDNFDFILKVAQIHDHKGILKVFWESAPTEREKDYFLRAWSSKIGDESHNVLHEVREIHVPTQIKEFA